MKAKQRHRRALDPLDGDRRVIFETTKPLDGDNSQRMLFSAFLLWTRVSVFYLFISGPSTCGQPQKHVIGQHFIHGSHQVDVEDQ